MRGFEKFGFIIAPRALVNRKVRVGWMYREEPDIDGDSGWRVFVGDESDTQLENSTYFDTYDVRTILEVDPSIENFLHAPEGSAFERDAAGILVPAKFDPPQEEE